MKLAISLVSSLLLSWLSSLAWAQQHRFSKLPPAAPRDPPFTPVGHLRALSDQGYTSLRHPYFPNHGARIKKSKFCDRTVDTYTGYIDIGVRHLFFYFFESRNDPEKDDIILWTNGGPGSSSALGLFLELGPCSVNKLNETVYNPHAWNTNANIFFIDQPVGVGFSYADFGETVYTTEEAAVDIAAFTAVFFENFGEFKGRSFHLSGESYGGRYLPLYGSAIYDNNAALEAAGYTPINLSSLIIGNGWTDVLTMLPTFYEAQCTQAVTRTPVQTISACIRMKEAIPRCLKWAKASCSDHLDLMNCRVASDFCFGELLEPYMSLGLDAYDMTHWCGVEGAWNCYPAEENIVALLNHNSTRAILGVSDVVPTFAMANMAINQAFMDGHVDHMHPTHHYVTELLHRGVRMLIYVGDNDFVANWIGEERWTRNLEWAHHDAFAKQPLREWMFEGRVAGLTRGSVADGLVFATVHGAGHLVPTNKPKESLAMLQRWLAQEPL